LNICPVYLGWGSFVQIPNNKGKIMRMYEKFFKRFLDFSLSLIALIVLSPLICIVAILVRIKLGHPIIFSQKRPGINEKEILVYKFRSMTSARDAEGYLLPDEIRLTKFGKILRSTSLDELPQLYSILKGDMSIIGPRPQTYENVAFMSERQRRRHLVTPGLTGLAQVNGRNAINWGQKLEYDLVYIDNITFWGDFKIFLKTIRIVLCRKDITYQGHATNETVGQFLLRTNQLSKDSYDDLFQKVRNIGN
jgi:lipopolysaccharide/colanic/teichoic acid biosynthesis glycosyltransferase